MPLYYSNFKSFSNKISRIFWFEQLFCMAFISYTERPISALSSVWEARAGLIWVDFNFVMSKKAPIWWSLTSWATQANHGHPSVPRLMVQNCPPPGARHINTPLCKGLDTLPSPRQKIRNDTVQNHPYGLILDCQDTIRRKICLSKGPFFYCHEECHFTWHSHFSVILSCEITVSHEMTLSSWQ